MTSTIKTLLAGLMAGTALLATTAQAAQRILVERNHTVRVALSAPAGSIIVGNPDIADVSVIDSHTVFVIGHGFGSSAVTITDRAGHTVFDGEIIVTAVEHGAITVYKGLKPSLMVCSNVCISEDPNASNISGVNAIPSNGYSAIGPTISSGAGNVASTIGAAAAMP